MLKDKYRSERSIKFYNEWMINLFKNFPLCQNLFHFISLLDHWFLNHLHCINLSIWQLSHFTLILNYLPSQLKIHQLLWLIKVRTHSSTFAQAFMSSSELALECKPKGCTLMGLLIIQVSSQIWWEWNRL